ncbi:hypothetical protein ACWKW6_04840 [Dyadobacter jiangsuensis]
MTTPDNLLTTLLDKSGGQKELIDIYITKVDGRKPKAEATP